MSGYLRRLADRTVGGLPVLEPRPRSRFERADPWGGSDGAVAGESWAVAEGLTAQPDGVVAAEPQRSAVSRAAGRPPVEAGPSGLQVALVLAPVDPVATVPADRAEQHPDDPSARRSPARGQRARGTSDARPAAPPPDETNEAAQRATPKRATAQRAAAQRPTAQRATAQRATAQDATAQRAAAQYPVAESPATLAPPDQRPAAVNMRAQRPAALSAPAQRRATVSAAGKRASTARPAGHRAAVPSPAASLAAVTLDVTADPGGPERSVERDQIDDSRGREPDGPRLSARTRTGPPRSSRAQAVEDPVVAEWAEDDSDEPLRAQTRNERRPSRTPRRTQPESPSTVTVTIGRVEVRPPPVPPAPDPAPAGPQPLSLDAYLDRRSQR